MTATPEILTKLSKLEIFSDFLSLCEKEPRLGYKSIFRIAKRLAGSLRRSNADILTLYEALLDEVEGSNSR